MVTSEAGPASADTALPAEVAPISIAELERMSGEYARTRDPRLREALILHHQRLVRSIAHRFLNSVETLEDLVQVGNIGLINAIDRYDPGHGTRFSTYATPTILGEIKRHFRDKTCGIKVPRWLQELHQTSRRMAQRMTQELGRVPTVAELAARLGEGEEAILEALECGEAMNLLSLDVRLDTGAGPGSGTLSDVVGRTDAALSDFEVYGDLRQAISKLNGREREVISLRYFDEMSQAKIAKKMSISQMHVSRLQRRALKRLREMLSDDARRRGGGGCRVSP